MGIPNCQPRRFRHASRRERRSAAVVHDVSLDDFLVVETAMDQGQLQDLPRANQISPGASVVLTLHFQEDGRILTGSVTWPGG